MEQRASLLGAMTLLGAPGLTTRTKKLLGTSASLLVTSALLVVTRTLLGTKSYERNRCTWGPPLPKALEALGHNSKRQVVPATMQAKHGSSQGLRLRQVVCGIIVPFCHAGLASHLQLQT